MSWIYLFDDDDNERECFGRWLGRALKREVIQDASLPPFALWMEKHGSQLPDLLVLDLYVNKSRETTLAFVRELKKHPVAKGLPIVILTRGAAVDEAPTAFEEAANEFVEKGAVLGRNGAGGLCVIASQESALRARLQARLSDGQSQRRGGILADYQAALVGLRGYALFERTPPFARISASSDAAKFLQSLPDGSGVSVPPELVPLIVQPTGHDTTIALADLREIRAQIVRYDARAVLIAFTDQLSIAYVRAVGMKAFKVYVKEDHRARMKKHMIDNDRWDGNVGDDVVENLVQALYGYLFSMGSVGIEGSHEARDLLSEAKQWHKEYLVPLPLPEDRERPDADKKEFPGSPTTRKQAAFNSTLKDGRFTKVNVLAREMRQFLLEHPLVESCVVEV